MHILPEAFYLLAKISNFNVYRTQTVNANQTQMDKIFEIVAV